LIGIVRAAAEQARLVKSTNALALVAALAAGCTGPVIRDIPMLRPDDPHFEIEHTYSVRSPQFERAVGQLLGSGVIRGNRVETLRNGDQIFPAMLKEIRRAKRSITFETFVYWDGEVADQFTDALAERARAGVATHVVIDWFGSLRITSDHVERMKEAGVQLNLYHELPWYNPVRWRALANVEDRTHRKILVVDGEVAFTGGVGIADEWMGNADSPKHWRDTHFRVTGPVVAQLQSVFVINWLETGGQLLHGDAYFPALAAAGRLRAHVFKGSPQEATESIELTYRLAIASARRSIKVSSAYFVPNPGTIKALVEAAERGVKVQIIVPGKHLDSALVKAASPALWGDLLRAGIEIHRYEPTMFHCKVMIVDDGFTSIGSINFDNRSFQLNDEVNVNVFDESFAVEQARIFADDLAHSERYTYEEWQHRPWVQKAVNWMARPFHREL
jgi:cardiolipin synthase